MTRDEKALRRTVRRLERYSLAERWALLRGMPAPLKRTLDEFWPAWAHEGQLAPARFGAKGAKGIPTWTMMTGRGFGKTRAGAEWVSALAREYGEGTRIALVGATI